MTENNYSEIKQEIIDKTIAIFRIIFENDIDNGLRDKNDDKKQSNKHQSPASTSGERVSDAAYTVYIEELISSRKLEDFIEKLYEKQKSNRVLQDLKEDLIRLLKNLETVENQRRNQAPPPVPPNYRVEYVYDSQEDEIPFFNDRENRNKSNHTPNQFTFNQLIGALMFALGCSLILAKLLIVSIRWMI